MMHVLRNLGLVGASAGALVALSACATVESVERAQATADQALSAAQAAQASADRAQASADAAGQAAQRAQSSADAANAAAQAAAAEAARLREARAGERG